MEPWGPMPWYGMIFGPIMMIAVLVTIIIVAVFLMRWLGGGGFPFGHQPPPYQRPKKPALEILEGRFARGEIDKEEFEEKKRLLSD